MDLETIFNNINTFYNTNYQKFKLTDPRFLKNDNYQITWYNHISNETFETYEEYYEWAFDHVQYSLKLEDDSLIQFFFEGEKEGKKTIIKKGSMSYLPNPYSYSEYFRFDIDLKNEEDYRHTSYHIHFGYRAKDVRFALYKYPLPSEFVKLIFFLHYNEDIKSFSKDNFWENLQSRNIRYNHILDLSEK